VSTLFHCKWPKIGFEWHYSTTKSSGSSSRIF
jgi:hypothetical protein